VPVKEASLVKGGTMMVTPSSPDCIRVTIRRQLLGEVIGLSVDDLSSYEDLIVSVLAEEISAALPRTRHLDIRVGEVNSVLGYTQEDQRVSMERFGIQVQTAIAWGLRNIREALCLTN
jgi:hypothetical protein